MSGLLIDAEHRKQIEKRRLLRMIAVHARQPSDGELARLRGIVRAIDPSAGGGGSLFVGMHAVTLVRENLAQLDPAGLASLKADGLHAHAAFVNSELKPGATERADAVLFVLRGATGALPQVFAIDRVFMHTRTPLMLDGELCLRKRRLTPDEFRAINSGQNVHTRPYLEYPSATDAQALADGVDIASDSYQSVYDAQFELVYAAFDCMYLQRKSQVNRPFAERVDLVHKLTESSPIVDQTKRYRDRLVQIQAAVAYAGGVDQFALRIFMKPMFPVQHVRASAMHAVPACMQGIATDGVIFNGATDTYVVGTNPRLLKWKPEHTADLVIVRQTGGTALLPQQYVLCAQEHGRPVSVSDNLLIDTAAARRLVNEYAADQLLADAPVLECVGVLRAVPQLEGTTLEVFWRPVQLRAEKRAPNSLETYQNVFAAVANHLDEPTVVAYLVQQQQQK
jgi:hypothetical protein